jgi:predicted lipoprotein with Yx(FWY)xxD motif
MILGSRHGLALTAALVLGLVTATAVMASAPGRSVKAPVITIKAKRFGDILATRGRLPLYYWSKEKNAGGKIRCTGRCAEVWPPVYLAKGQSMPRRLAGVKGTFGVVTRPDGRRQATYKGLALYAYHNDPPGTVLCDNVDGWFVVRV